MNPLAAKMKIKRWEANMIRDSRGQLKRCYWNQMVLEEILKLQLSANIPNRDHLGMETAPALQELKSGSGQ
jgi:hypothetical protein